MEVIKKSIYIINYRENKIEYRKAPENFNNYIEELFNHIINNKSTREYKTRSQHTEVVNLIVSIMSTTLKHKNSTTFISELDLDDKFSLIAERLLREEIKVQQKIKKLGTEVKRGSLIQAAIFDEVTNSHKYIVTKVDHSDFFDDNNFEVKTGFSKEKSKIWKSCLFEIDTNNDIQISEAKVYLDGTAQYWHDEFLQLDELNDDEFNTKSAFKAIDNLLSRKLKTKFPSDHVILRNSVIGYLKKPQHIDYSEMINSIFSTYEPSNIDKSALSIIKDQLLKLPEKKNFDNQFNSIPKVISARFKKVYNVNEGIDIKLSDSINDIEDIIISFEENGKKYIKIRTINDLTYNSFKN